MTQQELETQLLELMQRNEELERRLAEQNTRRPNTLSFKVGEKGGVSVYGVGRFPMTAYAETWIKVLNDGPRIIEFIKANKDVLKFKNGIKELGIGPTLAQAD
jgi:hypothetical protein